MRAFIVAIFVAALLFVFQGDSISGEKADSRRSATASHYEIIKNVEIVKSLGRTHLEREEGFFNLANIQIADRVADWPALKDGLLDILIADPNFFFTHIVLCEGLNNTFKNKFSLSWLAPGKSNYAEKRQLDLKQIERELESLEARKKAALEIKQVIEASQPTVVD
jgi:hypothetical protein